MPKKKPKKRKPAAKKAPPKPVGRPTKYRPEYDAMLEKHLARGYNFKSFGAVVDPPVAEHTLFNWLESHPSFLQSRKVGEALLEKYYIDLSKTMAAGQLRVQVGEKVVIGPDGKAVLHPVTGEVVTEKIWAPAKPVAAVHIFMMKNILKWTDRQEVKHTGDPDNPIHERKEVVVDATERLQEIERLRAKRELLGRD